MSLGKQAKTINDRQLRQFLDHVSHSRYALRDRCIVLLSFRAGLRAKEIAALTWAMIRTSDNELGDELVLPDRASKGKSGRIIPMRAELRDALADLEMDTDPTPTSMQYVIRSERGWRMTDNGIAVWFWRRYRELGFDGASSHSGRRTFITNAARKISLAGGSLRDVQALAGHSSLAVTQLYIDQNREAKRKVIEMI